MAFHFKAAVRKDGTKVRVRPDIWRACHRMVGKDAPPLRGLAIFAEFTDEDLANVTYIDPNTHVRGTKSLRWDGVRWQNLRTADQMPVVHAESPAPSGDAPAESAPVEPPLVSGVDERMQLDRPTGGDPEAEHHRGFPRF